MLTADLAVRSYLKTLAHRQKGGKYVVRSTVYVFKCVECEAEIEKTGHELNRATGRCRKCSDSANGKRQQGLPKIRPYEAAYNKFVYGRRQIGQDIDISFQDFLEFTKQTRCHYCDGEVTWPICALSRNGWNYNLDRKDNGLGYLRENCVVCCWDCNELKGAKLTYSEMVAVSALLKSMRRSKEAHVA